MTNSIKLLILGGCGGCQLRLLGMKQDIIQLFDSFALIDENDADKKARVGVVIGKIDKAELMNALDTCDTLIICGECANRCMATMEQEADWSGKLFHAMGCPVAPEEFVSALHCIVKGIRYAPPNYPLCFECKTLENECLLKSGQKCHGPITYAGCHAKCTSIGVACRGCRGTLDGAKAELLEEIWNKNVHHEANLNFEHTHT